MSSPESGPGKDYRLSHLAPEIGESYDAAFVNDPYRHLVWGLEQRILDRILAEGFADRDIRHLDFA